MMYPIGGRQTGRSVAAIEGLRAQQRCGFKVLYICATKMHEQLINRMYPDIPTETMNHELRGSKATVLWDHYAIETLISKKDAEIQRLKEAIISIRKD